MSAKIKDYLLHDEHEISVRDDLRIRPRKSAARTFGQGVNEGPNVNGQQFHWGGPLTVVPNKATPGEQEITLSFAKDMKHLLMTETRYHEYLSINSQPE